MVPDSQSAQERPDPADAGVSSPSPSGAASKPVTTLSRELADFLIEFSIALHKRSMYPAGHPHLSDSSNRFVHRMRVLLGSRESVTLGVARHRLLIDAVTTDPKNALLRDLAHRLHRHRLASVHFALGVTEAETEALLSALSTDPQRGDGPIGKRLDRVGPWDHIRLRAVGYDQLALQGVSDSDLDGEEPLPTRDSWIELAQLALASEAASDAQAADADPQVVAQAIDRKSGEVAYDRVVLGYLARMAAEMSGRRGSTEDLLLQRVSKLIGALDPSTLRRLLQTGADQAERRKFVLNASQVLAADAVLEVVEAAAQVSKQTISHNLLRLLHKLALHAESGSPEIRAAADGALRTNVAKLIDDWELEDPNPATYNAILEGMVRRSSAEYSLIDVQVGCDPDVILKMALELDCVGPAVYAAIEQLLARRELPRVAELLQAAPQTNTTQDLWRYVATPARLEAELAGSPMDQDAVRILVERIGTAATNSLLDRLATADDRSTRAAIMKQLSALGRDVAAVAIERLPTSPWYLQRNILVLLGRLGSLPDGFSPASYSTHGDPRIRREAIKLLLDTKDRQEEAIVMALGDADEGIVGLALAAAVESCPPRAIPLVHRIALDPKRPPELRALAVRTLTRARDAESLRVLLEVVKFRRRWFRPSLAPKSPDLLAALAGLATHWSDDPVARDVLAYARWHTDRQIRAAVALRSA